MVTEEAKAEPIRASETSRTERIRLLRDTRIEFASQQTKFSEREIDSYLVKRLANSLSKTGRAPSGKRPCSLAGLLHTSYERHGTNGCRPLEWPPSAITPV